MQTVCVDTVMGQFSVNCYYDDEQKGPIIKNFPFRSPFQEEIPPKYLTSGMPFAVELFQAFGYLR